jgi:hypothetical protein
MVSFWVPLATWSPDPGKSTTPRGSARWLQRYRVLMNPGSRLVSRSRCDDVKPVAEQRHQCPKVIVGHTSEASHDGRARTPSIHRS